MFDCAEHRSEFLALETKRHELLSDRMAMLFFEVRKLPKDIDIKNELELMLSLFRVKTEEELKQLEALEVPIVTQAIGAYREVVVSPQFRELERLRADARHNEASALLNVERKEREKWQGVVAENEATIAEQAAEIERLRAQLAKQNGNNN